MDIDIIIYQDGDMFVAKSVIDGIASQGNTIEEAKQNLQEAVELYYEDEDNNENYKYLIESQSNLFISRLRINNIPRFRGKVLKTENKNTKKQYA